MSNRTPSFHGNAYWQGFDSTNLTAYTLMKYLRTTQTRKIPYSSSRSCINGFPFCDTWDALLYTDDSNLKSLPTTYRELDHGSVTLKYSNDGALKCSTGLGCSWSREHSWPRSWGVGSSNANDDTDLHALFPALQSMNSARSNKAYYQITSSEFNGARQPARPHASTGSADAASSSAQGNWVFMPGSSERGDLARAQLYMALRYDGSEAGTANLKIGPPGFYHIASNRPDGVNSAFMACPDTGNPEDEGTCVFGDLAVLIHWHCVDAVDSFERLRNGKVQQLQGNRNPFVDHPEWVETIYGLNCTGAMAMTSRGSMSKIKWVFMVSIIILIITQDYLFSP